MRKLFPGLLAALLVAAVPQMLAADDEKEKKDEPRPPAKARDGARSWPDRPADRVRPDGDRFRGPAWMDRDRPDRPMDKPVPPGAWRRGPGQGPMFREPGERFDTFRPRPGLPGGPGGPRGPMDFHGAFRPPLPDPAAVFRRLDRNGDGKLGFEEFLAGWKRFHATVGRPGGPMAAMKSARGKEPAFAKKKAALTHKDAKQKVKKGGKGEKRAVAHKDAGKHKKDQKHKDPKKHKDLKKRGDKSPKTSHKT